MTLEIQDLGAGDDHTIEIYDWRPSSGEPFGVIQVLHGMGEHAERYGRFASACNASGLAVVSHNHRGHGSLKNYGHFADDDGWNKVIADVLQVRQHLAEMYPQRPVVLLGHSMGSFIAQSFVVRHGGNNVALILSGSTLPPRIRLHVSHLAAGVLCKLVGTRHISKFLNQAGLGNFNSGCKPARTESDWISRDEQEVDRYIADPLCGGLFSNRFWFDLTGGLLEISSYKSIAAIRHDLPVMIMGGEADPVGGEKGLTRLAKAYQRTAHDEVTLTIYAGGRHEMLNETNRDEVTTNIIAWIEQILIR